MEKPFTIEELNQVWPRLRATVEAAARMVDVQRALAQIAEPGARLGRPPGPLARNTALPGTRGRKNNPTSASSLRERIVTYLRAADDGAALREIADALHADAEAVRYGLNLLRDDKRVRMSGARATALWHVEE